MSLLDPRLTFVLLLALACGLGPCRATGAT
jgi:hypothetical protein